MKKDKAKHIIPIIKLSIFYPPRFLFMMLHIEILTIIVNHSINSYYIINYIIYSIRLPLIYPLNFNMGTL